MQPYFFPYIGYFHLVSSADVFIFFDDVQYIDRGWSNRNRILVNGKAHTITLPVQAGPRSATYRERDYCLENIERSILRPIRFNYAKAPQFSLVMPLIEDILSYESSNVALFNGNLIEKISKYLGISTEFKFSSDIGVDASLKAQDRIIAIARAIGTDRYINPAGGRGLYSAAAFDAAGVELRFLEPELISYSQFSPDPVLGLSIIDVLMFNSVESIRQRLWSWELASP
jgi:hypothetical protein